MFATTPPEGANLDAARHVTERIPPARYLALSYYERWLDSLTAARVEGGLVTVEEVTEGHPVPGSARRDDAAGPETVDPYQVFDFRRDVTAAPRFRPGDAGPPGRPRAR